MCINISSYCITRQCNTKQLHFNNKKRKENVGSPGVTLSEFRILCLQFRATLKERRALDLYFQYV